MSTTPTIVEEPKPPVVAPEPVAAPAPVVEPPATTEPAKEPEPGSDADRQAVDAYLTVRDEKKKHERGGKQAKIEQLTKEKAELEARAKDAEAKALAAQQKADDLAKKVPAEAPKPTSTEPKPRPKMADFQDVEEYHAAMALWAAEQRPVPAQAVPAPTTAAPAPDTKRQEEFDRFLERGKAFVVSHPDFNDTLQAAHVRGLTMSEQAGQAITKLAAPEVVYWLAKPENDLAARNLMRMDDFQQVIEIGKIAERLAVKPSDFVSNAPQPGTRLTGSNARPQLALNEITDTDEYIRERKAQRRNGRSAR
jgi:hypothetical protein